VQISCQIINSKGNAVVSQVYPKTIITQVKGSQEERCCGARLRGCWLGTECLWSPSAEGDEIELHGGRVAIRRDYLDGSGIGREGFCGKFQFEGGTHRTARAVAPTAVEWVAPENGGGNQLVAVIHLDSEVFPEVRGTWDENGRRSGSRASRIGDESTIGCCEINLHGDLDGLFLIEVIEAGLLGTVRAETAIGELGELRERGEERDGRDVGAGLGRREKLDVSAQEGCIMALAEEIGFADGFVGERGIEGRGRQRHTKSHEEAGEEMKEVAH
jgi:hypothetical protein